MPCKHDQYKCINNRFFCLICGAEIANPFAVKQPAAEAEKPAEGPKKPAEAPKTARKRKTAQK